MEPPSSPAPRALTAAGYQPLVILATPWALGIALDNWLHESVDHPWLRPGLPCWSIVMVAALCLWRRWLARGWSRGAMLALALAVVSLGAIWHHVHAYRFPADHLTWRITERPTPVMVEVELRSEPRRVMTTSLWRRSGRSEDVESEVSVEVRGLRSGRRWVACSGAARLFVPGELSDLHCGDRVRVGAVATRPPPAANPGEFDVEWAERAQRRLVRLQARTRDALTVVERARQWNWRGHLAWLRGAAHQCLRRHVRVDQAELASALLLGTREQLDRRRNQAFFETGLAHLLAISGLNVAIFAYGFWAVVRLGWFPRKLALMLVACLAVFYALLTGADPPVVRAAILVVCVCVARLLARQGLAYNTLAAAALLILAANPLALFQTGTQLSFLAVAVLCRVSARRQERPRGDPLQVMIERARPWWWKAGRRAGGWLAGAFLTSGQVWLVSLPLVVWKFHLISPIALVLNPLVVVPTAVALYAGFFVIVVSPLSRDLADAAGGICGVALDLVESCIAWGQGIPGNHVWSPGPTGEWVLAFYVAVALVTLLRVPRPVAWLLGGMGVALLLGPVNWWGERRPTSGDALSREAWRCTFVAVGHGTSVLVESPEGRTMLYDCGRLGAPSSGARSIAALLWSRGISRLDAVVLSHADSDHFNALPELLQRFEVETVYVSPHMFRRPDEGLAAVREELRRRGILCRVLRAGDRLASGEGARFEVLLPVGDETGWSDNAVSLVLSLDFPGGSLLLPGDLEGAGMRALVARPSRPYDVVMAPHHGSSQSQPGTLFDWANPSVIVVSGSARTATSTTESEPDRALDVVGSRRRRLHTALDGALHLEISPGRLRIWNWRGRWRSVELHESPLP